MHYYLSRKQAQTIDRYTQEVIGIPSLVLMERAALKLAEAIRELCESMPSFDRRRDRILAVAESGNNGGDALACARILKGMGYECHIFEAGGLSRKSPSFETQERIAKNSGVRFAGEELDRSDTDGLVSFFGGYRILIDGLFGIGLNRPVEGLHLSLIAAMNRSAEEAGCVIVGCDIPSGICSDTGHILGAAVKCSLTVSFQYVKFGMLFAEGRECSGRILCADIGLFAPDDAAALSAALSPAGDAFLFHEYGENDLREHLPEKKPDSNKGNGGKVLIVAGSEDIYGALDLCAEACFRTGAGLVKVVSAAKNRDLLMSRLPEAMFLSRDGEADDPLFAENYKKAIAWADVILIGPGLGTDETAGSLLNGLIENCRSGQSIVMDADALNLISARGPKDIFRRIREKLGDLRCVITPHMAEMKRLLGETVKMAGLKDRRVEYAADFSASHGLICILKDARTIVTGPRPEGPLLPVYLNTAGNAGMAKGGSGDVLAGITAGLLAQAGPEAKDLFGICCSSVNLHARAGDKAGALLGSSQMLARDIIRHISFE
ncbi:MAG: NAD(P)H-hydrate dehydratase [Lachnospiraceae bacterium]|nr:NAD(P)H-hydrate dehydratase [Lachnospiraceae bacterium]